MPPAQRQNPTAIKNKIKREEVTRSRKKAKRQEKLKRRLALAEAEKDDPTAREERKAKNIPKTLDNMREFDASMLPATSIETMPVASSSTDSSTSNNAESAHPIPQDGISFDIANDQFAEYFMPSTEVDPTIPPKVLITTSMKATKVSYEFCEELVGIFPGAEFIRRKKGPGFEMGRIAGWAADRGYNAMLVVNEDSKKSNAITFIHLPAGPTAYFKLTSIELSKKISGHARASPHDPELALNGFVTRLGHTIGRMFQTLFPPLPEFEGRQVVTLHNQRDFIFFRRHRYMFRSPEKVALQEIGPRFTLKLRWLKKNIPAVRDLGAAPPPLVLASEKKEEDESEAPKPRTIPPKEDEYLWMWKPELEVTRKTFFL
jgi:ribosome production factor 1